MSSLAKLEEQFSPAQLWLTSRTYFAVRNRFGSQADSLEGIAAAGRARISNLVGVGALAMAELDEALNVHGLSWSNAHTEVHPAPVAPKSLAWPVLRVPRLSPAREAQRKHLTLVDQITSAVICDPVDEAALLGLVRGLPAALGSIPALDATLSEITLLRLVDGMPANSIAMQLGVSLEQVRGEVKKISPPWIAYRGSLCRALVAEQSNFVKARFRGGDGLDLIVQDPRLQEFNFGSFKIKNEVNSSVLSRKDRDIHSVRAPGERHAPEKAYSDLELLDGIRMVGRELGRAPSVNEYDAARERYRKLDDPIVIACRPTLTKRFGFWSAAVRSAGFDVVVNGVRSDRVFTAGLCIELLLDLTRQLDYFPTVEEYGRIMLERRSDPEAAELPTRSLICDRFGHELGNGRWQAIGAYIIQRLLDAGEW